ncbi:tripartite tricarboxylate transporter substrate binding protein [Hahella sp. HN01]|uniref:Bug family tripartite tricarboxylate transporter substrate binding protein n=1 Tax=Hahella sp. HN01 TaxID=2847262 RepID=UPI001C1EFA8A|nr:tripartite tricarboxylate transporter substrate-binding protein [Hahella sp. HN01]MBU6953548.1 tripartite tricarboxylate transporter substrate binding protein [Hahella sp. HN01]
MSVLKRLSWLTFFLGFSLFVGAKELAFLIPGGEGGGWDTTARETGATMQTIGLVDDVKFTNLSGGGGGRALDDLVRNAPKYSETLMVQSTPLILRSLTGVIDKDFRDITPIATVIAEYQVVAVKADSPIQSVPQLADLIRDHAAKNPIIGGSSKESLDHITAALLLKSAGIGIDQMRYVPSDGGGDALEKLYKEVGVALVTGLGEVVNDYKSGKLRLLGVTSDERLEGFDIPTMKEQGYDLVFANWRGFFGPPGMPAQDIAQYADMLEKLSQSDQWKQVRSKYGWSNFYHRGDAMHRFLENQEKDIREVLLSLGVKVR